MLIAANMEHALYTIDYRLLTIPLHNLKDLKLMLNEEVYFETIDN